MVSLKASSVLCNMPPIGAESYKIRVLLCSMGKDGAAASNVHRKGSPFFHVLMQSGFLGLPIRTAIRIAIFRPESDTLNSVIFRFELL